MLEQTLQQMLMSCLNHPLTTMVFIYKMLEMLEMLSSTEIGLAYLQSRYKAQPYNSVPGYNPVTSFPQLTYLVLRFQSSPVSPPSPLAFSRCPSHSPPRSLVQLYAILTSPTLTSTTDVDWFGAAEPSFFHACRTPGVADLPRIS